MFRAHHVARRISLTRAFSDFTPGRTVPGAGSAPHAPGPASASTSASTLRPASSSPRASTPPPGSTPDASNPYLMWGMAGAAGLGLYWLFKNPPPSDDGDRVPSFERGPP